MDLLELYLNIKSGIIKIKETFSRTFNNESASVEEDSIETSSYMEETEEVSGLSRSESRAARRISENTEESPSGAGRVVPILALFALLIKVVVMYIAQSIRGTAKDDVDEPEVEIREKKSKKISIAAVENSQIGEVAVTRNGHIKKTNKKKRNRRRKILGYVGVSAAVFVVALCAIVFLNHQMVAVNVNGNFVGYASNKAEGAEIVDSAKNSISKQNGNTEIILDEAKITYNFEFVKDMEAAQKVDEASIAEEMVENDVVKAKAFTVTVNGTKMADVATQEDADAILAEIEKKYVGDDPAIKGEFVDSITVDREEVDLDSLEATASVVEHLLSGGGVAQEIYEVQEGDTIESICSALNETQESLAEANPDKDLAAIIAGDQLVVNKVVPLINYQTVATVAKIEEIEFTTREEETDTLFVEETEVQTEGELGSRTISIEEIRINGKLTQSTELSNVVDKEPVEKVVLIGTKERPVVVEEEEEEEPEAASSNESSSNNSGSNNNSGNTAPAPAPAPPQANGTGIVNDAHKYLGVPYVHGGSSPSGFDCSGFVQYVYRANGISIPRTSSGISGAGTYVALADAQPGDILCWGSPGNSSHVGIYIGNNSYIHSPVPGQTVRIASFGYYNPSFAVRF